MPIQRAAAQSAVGRHLVDEHPAAKEMTFQFDGPALNIDSAFSVTCGDVEGNVTAGSTVSCGDVTGSINSGKDVMARIWKSMMPKEDKE